MTPPDSGEREVRYCQHGCQHRATSCDVCPACVYFVADRAVPVPLPLAQRILAALEKHDPALAAELRACVEGKS